MHRVLLVTDGSPNALRATRTAADMVHQSHGEVVIIYVIPPVPTLAKTTVSKGGAGLNDIVTGLLRAMRTGHAALTQAANILTLDGISYIAQLEQGVPANVIYHFVRQENYDAVVIGSSGLDRTTTLALGAISMRKDECASCAVVIVS